MARVKFTAEAKKSSGFAEFEKLKLKKGESARIWVYEEPVMQYVHSLREPKIENGKPVMEDKKRKDGSTYQDYETVFKGNPICFGDPSILEDKGSDPKRCPICREAKENPGIADAPKRRYAMNVIKYRMKPGSTTELAKPFTVENVVWAFTDQRMNKIIDAQLEWEKDGGLKRHDLILGPCENEGFQKYDIRVAPDAKVAEKPEYVSHVKEVRDESIYDEKILDQACGSVKEERWILQDLASIKEAWAEINNATAENLDSIDDVLNNIDDTNGWASEEDAAKTNDLDDLLGTVADASEDTEEPVNKHGVPDFLPEEDAADEDEDESSEDSNNVADFDDLLANL